MLNIFILELSYEWNAAPDPRGLCTTHSFLGFGATILVMWRKQGKQKGCISACWGFAKMLAFFRSILDWIKSLFWKEEMELTLVGLQYSGKTTFVNVIAVSLMYVWDGWELFMVNYVNLFRLTPFASYIYIWLVLTLQCLRTTPIYLSLRICT